MTGAEALRIAVPLLKAAGVDDPVRDARILLAWALDIGVDRLTLHLHDPVSQIALDAYNTAITARAARHPVSHIVGSRAFWGREFHVTSDVLDPRPETETLVAATLQRSFSRVLDLGTGSGAIVLTLLAERPGARGVGVDLSPAAIAVAQRNASALGLTGQASFQVSDWFDAVDGHFDLIVSNPPYIAAAEMADLAPEVRLHEPRMALTPGGDGLEAYRKIAASAGKHMTIGARILLEIGPTQGQDVVQIFTATGFVALETLPDMDGRDRVVAGVWPG